MRECLTKKRRLMRLFFIAGACFLSLERQLRANLQTIRHAFTIIVSTNTHFRD